MKTRLIAWLVCMALLCLNASEPWQFLPNFQCDVRGIETSFNSNADVFRRLPATAEKLLSADSPLTEKQRDELYWRPASFPHRDFVNLMPERGFGNHAFAEYNGLIFDACAGPVIGTLTAQYLSNTIDRSTAAENANAGNSSNICSGFLNAIY